MQAELTPPAAIASPARLAWPALATRLNDTRPPSPADMEAALQAVARHGPEAHVLLAPLAGALERAAKADPLPDMGLVAKAAIALARIGPRGERVRVALAGLADAGLGAAPPRPMGLRDITGTLQACLPSETPGTSLLVKSMARQLDRAASQLRLLQAEQLRAILAALGGAAGSRAGQQLMGALLPHLPRRGLALGTRDACLFLHCLRGQPPGPATERSLQGLATALDTAARHDPPSLDSIVAALQGLEFQPSSPATEQVLRVLAGALHRMPRPLLHAADLLRAVQGLRGQSGNPALPAMLAQLRRAVPPAEPDLPPCPHQLAERQMMLAELRAVLAGFDRPGSGLAEADILLGTVQARIGLVAGAG